jgi:hypothetical protein
MRPMYPFGRKGKSRIVARMTGAEEPRAEREQTATDSFADAAGLARVAGGAWLRTAQWAAESYLRAGRRLARAAVNGENPMRVVDDAIDEARKVAREVLGVSDLESRLSDFLPGSRDDDEASGNGRPTQAPLREHGAELLRRSADVEDDEDGDVHPAYERILGSITPDEARILRLLATEGPQAAIDVRTWRPLGIGSELVEPGLNMIGAEAGARHVDRVHRYLNNLFRLGLVWFSREQIDELGGYQVLEAQPETIEALKRAGRATTVRRSIRLTPFGTDFCETCLPLHTGEFAAVGIAEDEATAIKAEAAAQAEAVAAPELDAQEREES